jgi:hypothetical protein
LDVFNLVLARKQADVEVDQFFSYINRGLKFTTLKNLNRLLESREKLKKHPKLRGGAGRHPQQVQFQKKIKIKLAKL